MSLIGALNLGGSSLAANQAALQVTGNNIANAGTAGYSRQVINLTSSPDVLTSSGQYAGSGVTVSGIQRQVSAALNEGLRDAGSDQNAADSLNTELSQLQGVFGPLNDNDLSSQLSSFFNSFSTLANNPSDTGQRGVVVQSGVSLSSSLQTLRSQLSGLRDDAQTQIGTIAQSANSLAQQIASLNGQISSVGTSDSAANSLLDQRDQALSQLSQLVDIRVVDQGGGNLNVMVGSVPLVSGSTSRGVSTKQVPDATNSYYNTQLVFGDNGDPIPASGGQLGGLVNARDNYITPAISTLDTLAAGLISAVNTVHSQGQGLTGFSSVTGTTEALDPTANLNAPASGIKFPPTNGSFNLYMTDATTGLVSTQQINVNLSGQGAQTTMNSLAASITAAGGGTVSAAVDPAGKLVITSSNPNVTFGFGEDTSGTLAAVGVNTFFAGSTAADINVNQTLQDNSSLLATGRGNAPGSNQNAQALALAGAASVSGLGGKSLGDYYATYIGNLASDSQSAVDNSAAHKAIHDTLLSQQQAISGVSMDEEAINLTQYQRAFEGSARFITVVDEMLQTVLGLIT